MGCVSSNLLNQDDDITRLGSSALSQHIVSLSSTTYGFLNLDPLPQNPNLHSPITPPPRVTLGSVFSDPKPLRSDPDVINSWELMAGLDADSFRFSPSPIPKPKPSAPKPPANRDKENSNPNLATPKSPIDRFEAKSNPNLAIPRSPIERFQALCPPAGENKAVIYTTSLRGIRKTFEACIAVRAAIEACGVAICERDVSMDRGFREELRVLMEGKGTTAIVPPRVFVKGRYLGGAEEVMKMADEGCLGNLLIGLPKRRAGDVCEGCGGARFLTCFHCNGSCKVLVDCEMEKKMGKRLVLRCCECNENGLVICPICG